MGASEDTTNRQMTAAIGGFDVNSAMKRTEEEGKAQPRKPFS
ncbi:hypothetical protein ACQ4M4_17150 [Leptolyngbya sp. AN02str]